MRGDLERLYSCRVDDAVIDHEDHAGHKEDCLKVLREADSTFTSFAGSVRSIKSVVETCLIMMRYFLAMLILANLKIHHSLTHKIILRMIIQICYN